MSDLVQHANDEGGGTASRSDVTYGLQEQIVRNARARRRRSIWLSAAVFIAAATIAAVGFQTETNVNAWMGEWRSGIVLLLGSALIFAYTVRLQLAMQYRDRLDELGRLQRSNAALAERVRRRLEERSISTSSF